MNRAMMRPRTAQTRNLYGRPKVPECGLAFLLAKDADMEGDFEAGKRSCRPTLASA
jgi:hypothetical protein